MYVVQIGHYAWLGTYADKPCVTTSAAHASRFNDFPANERAQWLRDNLKEAFANSVLHRRLRDFYATAPVTVVPVSEVEARLSRPVLDKPEVSRLAQQDVAPRANGITRQIYQWTLDNPDATKADAIAAFPSANPSTVGVQFSAARRSAQVS